MKIWHSIFHRSAYAGNEPSFYNKDDFEWTALLESNWELVLQELDTHLAACATEKSEKVNIHGRWKTMPLKTWGVEFHKNVANFPKTSHLLNQIPGLVSASFNLLESNAEIGHHFGETNASIRAHLGLRIPKNWKQVGIEVNGKVRHWEAGKVLLFCDGFEHSAWNHSEEDRYILLLDVIRPEFAHKKNWICTSVLSTLFLQHISFKSSLYFFATSVPITILHSVGKICALIAYPVRNMLGKQWQKLSVHL